MAHRNKTNKSVKKRMRVTGTGKLKYSKCGKRHLNAHFTAKRATISAPENCNASVTSSTMINSTFIAHFPTG